MYTAYVMPVQIPKTNKSKQTSFRFSEEFKNLLVRLAACHEVSQARVIEFAVERLAIEDGLIAAPSLLTETPGNQPSTEE